MASEPPAASPPTVPAEIQLPVVLIAAPRLSEKASELAAVFRTSTSAKANVPPWRMFPRLREVDPRVPTARRYTSPVTVTAAEPTDTSGPPVVPVPSEK